MSGQKTAVPQKSRLLIGMSLASAFGVLGIGINSPLAMGQSAESVSVLAGVYNEEQATRGQALYYEHCLNCHGETLAGVDKAPALSGPQFGSTWNDAPLATLVARILTMPPEKPGSLSQEQSVAVLSYILWYNGLPLGDMPLPSDQDALTKLTFQTPLPAP